MASKRFARPDISGYTARTLDLERELREGSECLAEFAAGELTIEMLRGHDTLWCLVRRPGRGGLAIRTARNAGPVKITGRTTRAGGKWRVAAACGIFEVSFQILEDELLRLKVVLTPSEDLLIPFWSRDLYPLDASDSPRHAKGWVEAAQRGLNAGLCYLCMDEPDFGSVLYLQDLTSLNDYFIASKTKPDGVVGGQWPELGYQPPTSPMGNSPPIDPLKAGVPVTISDALIAFRGTCAKDEHASASLFLEMLGGMYPHLTKPTSQFHDWVERSQKTLRDLGRRPQAIVEHYGHIYLHPYTESEYPDSMVQMSVIAGLREYERRFGVSIPLADELFSGMSRFYDKDLGTLRRYLPNVGDDKDANAVDSWYLYHPLMNLGRLAVAGDAKAKALFVDSLEFGIRAAKHFKYKWPIQYDVRDFKIVTESRNDQGLGQTDVGGLYGYVMLLAHEVTGDRRYVKEAQAALEALREARFELVYQTNLSAWGVAACARLWRLENDQAAFAQSLVFLAGLFHNSVIWDSKISNAANYANFFGVTCLHDAPYLAAYECFEAFAAIDEYLDLGNTDLPVHVRMLCLEFRKYSLDRGWYFYPDALPGEAIAKDDIRNGYIERKFSFPLEDLYADGQPAGQVGQEIYGCGGAFVFASRSIYVPPDNAPFLVFCEYPFRVQSVAPGELYIELDGPEGVETEIRMVPRGRRTMPSFTATDGAEGLRAVSRDASRIYRVSADSATRIRWSRRQA